MFDLHEEMEKLKVRQAEEDYHPESYKCKRGGRNEPNKEKEQGSKKRKRNKEHKGWKIIKTCLAEIFNQHRQHPKKNTEKANREVVKIIKVNEAEKNVTIFGSTKITIERSARNKESIGKNKV